MARLTLQWSAVPPEIAAAFRSVSSALADSDFYLAGGTALALRLGHRLSVDLDLFSPTLDAVEPLLTTLRASLPGFVVTATAPRTLEGALDGVEVSFFGFHTHACGRRNVRRQICCLWPPSRTSAR